MSEGKRISIVTVVRNGAELLEETIRSVIPWQSRVRLDYLVVDGGSTDGTVEVIRRYEQRIRYWVSEPDGGIYDAMNKGWTAAADGSFILFLGAGDRLISLPDDLERYAENDVIFGDVLTGERSFFASRADFRLKLYNSLHHQALLVNKARHPQPPFDTRYRIYADFDFNQRLLKGGARFVRSGQLKSYAHPGGVSDQRCFRETLAVIRCNFGIPWTFLALAGYAALKMLPFLKRLRPCKIVTPGNHDQ